MVQALLRIFRMRQLKRGLASSLLTLVTGLTALAGTPGCLDADEAEDPEDINGKADGAGTNGSIGYIQSNSPFYWAASDYLTFYAAAGFADFRLAGDDDLLAMRLQAWVDKIDAMVRSEMSRTAHINLVAPKPIVKILASGSTFNAWVTGVYACGDAQQAGAIDGSVTAVTRDVVYQNQATCLRTAWPQGLSELITFWNRVNPTCRMRADGSFFTGGGCLISGDQPGRLAIAGTGQYIHVSTDLIASLDEKAMVLVLAHELAHYYRAHTSEAKTATYNFWYDNEIDRKKRPVPAANAKQLADQYAALVAGPSTIATQVPGKYSARLRSFILSAVAPQLQARVESNFVCANARDALGSWREPLLHGGGLPNDNMEAYLQFERALVACAPSLTLGGEANATTLSYGKLIDAIAAAKLGKLSLPFRATLADVLTVLDGAARKLDAKEAALLASARQNRIGIYTIEQEADDLAMEFVARLGMTPDEAITAWLKFMDGFVSAVPEVYQPQYAAENQTCRTWLANDFTVEENGRKVPVYVPIGDLSEPHHSTCYRLFNFWRNKKLQRYNVAAPIAWATDWDNVVALARAYAEQGRANGY